MLLQEDDMKEIKIIFLYFKNSLLQMAQNIPIVMVFFLSKLIRYVMFFVFIYFLVTGIVNVGGYSREQMLFFYLVFNIIDTLGQLLYREVYRFRPLVISGGLDFVLLKPANPLIRVLVGGPDFIDLGILVILLGITGYLLIYVIKPDLLSLGIFLVLAVNSMLITTAFHILVLGIGILTFSVDHLVMIYRDLTALMRIPVDLFTDPLRSVLTFAIPIGIMFTFPAKALFGLLDWRLTLISLAVGLISLILSIKFWNFSLKHYQGAGG